ncbi:hypothetical protein PHLCEN_2v874 [Hermanssonia centrifuga]|uniref:Uncharacterized protein n=1 Tax=Hermanssonia centrifuga TaxID=98765 RepID=A0A2R6S4S4_9APHY|nr:hypothetical protein PHLCEN_2v874 [Hermanssonia centrifuga]
MPPVDPWALSQLERMVGGPVDPNLVEQYEIDIQGDSDEDTDEHEVSLNDLD